MKVEKTIKKIRKAIEKIPDVRNCLIDTVDSGGHFRVGAKNKVAFRFFRDQLEGDDAKAVNHIYGIGGRMEVFYGNGWLTVNLYDENSKRAGRIELGRHPEAADNTNYALPV